MGYVQESLGENETVIYEAHFHRLYFAAAWVASIFFVALPVAAVGFTSDALTWVMFGVSAAGLVLVLYWMIPVWTTEIAVTNHRLVVKRGWLSHSTNELQLKSIEQVVFHQGLLGRIFDFGKIEVHGTGVDDLRLPNIACPMELVKAIENASSPLRRPPLPVAGKPGA